MMPLPAFELARPGSLDDAIALLRQGGDEARLLAGGTDLLVNMKQGISHARLLVHVGRLDELRGIATTSDGGLHIGAGERLADIAAHPTVQTQATALAQACARVAHPQARQMGTIGGNICLDVRCQYVNRTAAWRSALGGCLKAEGPVCHVVPGGRICVAALSGDTVAALVALDAQAEVVGPDGRRRVAIADLRNKDGRAPLTLGPADVVVAVHLPPSAPRQRSAYDKWAVRKAVDFPLVSVGMVCSLDDHDRLASLRVATGVLGPRPKLIDGLDAFLGQRIDPRLAEAVSDQVARRSKPLPNVLIEPGHRRRVLGVLVRRQLESWATT